MSEQLIQDGDHSSRGEMKSLHEKYDDKIKRLEARIAELEAKLSSPKN
jgi:BMFP domain-containing protein YqiC